MSLSKHSRTFTNSEAVKILSHTLDELRRLPGEHSVSSELGGLRQLYGALCPLYSKSTHSSSANRRKIEKVTNSNSLEKVSKHFDRWTADPLGFWEKPIDKSKRYSDKAINEQDRARLFLISAYELDGTIEEQRILQRFVPLAAFRLFRRLVPNITSRISSQHVEKFLDAVGIQPTETAIQTYGSIIRRGCRTQAICHKAKNMDRTKNVDDSDLDAGQYWILFLDDIPDSCWGPQGFKGVDIDKSLEHLRKVGVSRAPEAMKANVTAKYLLQCHDTLVWPSSGKRKTTGINPTFETSKRQRAEPSATENNLCASDEVDSESATLGRERSLDTLASIACSTSSESYTGHEYNGSNPQPLSTQPRHSNTTSWPISPTPAIEHPGDAALHVSEHSCSHETSNVNHFEAPSLGINDLILYPHQDQQLGANLYGTPLLDIGQLDLYQDQYSTPSLGIDELNLYRDKAINFLPYNTLSTSISEPNCHQLPGTVQRETISHPPALAHLNRPNEGHAIQASATNSCVELQPQPFHLTYTSPTVPPVI